MHDDLVRREFGADAPNQLRFADLTEHPTAEGKLYLCAVRDAYSGRMVGYSIDSLTKERCFRPAWSAPWAGGVTDDGTFFTDGAAYDLRTNSWRDIAPVPGGGVAYATAEWTGDEIILWGGVSREGWSDGWRYDLATDSWKPTAPAPVLGRVGHATTWTGSEMVVWGGTQRNERGPHFADGAAYDPQANSWRGLPSSPISDRFDHTAVWTGSEFMVWGGTNEIRGDSMPPPLKDGAALAFADMSWRYLPPAPIGARYRHSSAWTGTEMLVWGGCCVSEESRAGYVDGAMYSPA